MPAASDKTDSTPVKKTRKRQGSSRLTIDDWILAAGKLLATNGIDAVRVEPLAKIMKVTKGSFYWHFKERKTLLTAVLNNWRRRATSDVIERLNSPSLSPRGRLNKLLKIPQHDKSSLEMAIRQWAKNDAMANEAIIEIDSHRHRYITSIYLDLGFNEKDAKSRAFLLYSTMLGISCMPNSNTYEMLKDCKEMLLKDALLQD